MIDFIAIATSGYFALQPKDSAASIALDGYYPNDIIDVIDFDSGDGRGRQRIPNDEVRGNRWLKEDDELITIIISYLQSWH